MLRGKTRCGACARFVRPNDSLLARTTPLLERLRDTSKETVILGKRQGDSVIYLQVLEGPHAIRYSARPGEFKPLHSSAMGKAMLGSLKEPELRAVLDGLKLSAVTAETLTDADSVVQDVLKGRRRGYHLTCGENVPDELIEATCPLRIEHYGFVRDTGGAGQYRVGLAVRRDVRFLGRRAVLQIRSDRAVVNPWGLADGEPGTNSSNVLLSADGDARKLPSKIVTEIVARAKLQLTGGRSYP